MTFPDVSVIVTIVLLNELLMCTTPVEMFLRSRLRGRRPPGFGLAIALLPHSLLLVGNGALRALAGACVGVGALATDRQPLAVPNALQAPDLDLALDVGLHVAAQVALDREVLVDVVTDLVDLVLGQLRDLGLAVEPEIGRDLLDRGLADAIDIGERDLQPLLAGDVDAGDTCHVLGDLCSSRLALSPGAACGAGSRR